MLIKCNNYIARDLNNKIKYKGAFEIVPMANGKKVYWKDMSMKIVPIALSEYFLNRTPIRETIINHTNIFDFCKRFRATEGWISETRHINISTTPNKNITKQEKIEIVENNGWIDYYDSWIKTEWVINNKPYDRMACSLDDAYKSCLNPNYTNIEKQQKNIRYYISNSGSTLMKVHRDGRESNIEKGWLITIFNKFIQKPIKDYNINYQYYINECNKIIDTIEEKQLTLF